MPGYSLVPVDYQPDFDDYSLVPVDYDPFAADGPIQQARTQLASQPQPDAGFDQPPSAPQTPPSAPPLPPIVPNGGQAPSVPQPPGQDLHSQYQALRPMLGDRNAMLATVYPEVRQTLIAQALAGRQQPGQTSEPAPTGGVSGVTQQAQTPTQPAQPQPQTQPQQPATGAGQPGGDAPAAGGGPSGSAGGGIGPTGGDAGGVPNPTLDQGAAKAAPFGSANPAPTDPPTPNGGLTFLHDEKGMVDSYVYAKKSTGIPPAGPQATSINRNIMVTATDNAKPTNSDGVYGHTLILSEPGSNNLLTITAADPTGLLVATPVKDDPTGLRIREYKGY